MIYAPLSAAIEVDRGVAPITKMELEAGRTAHALNLPYGGSSRLLAHRLNTYSAAQAATQGPRFVAMWEKLRTPGTERAAAAASLGARQVTAPAVAPVAAKPAPPPPSPSQRAAIEAQRRHKAEAVAARRKIVEQQAAERRQAEIAETWRRAHARIHDPLGHNEPEDPTANHGWSAIHAKIREGRGC